jgi:small subunit ribosomal protein S3
VIGKKGEDVEKLRKKIATIAGVPAQINIAEVRKPELDSQLVADSISSQLERRVMFRRAMKRAVQNAMRLGAQGIKIMSSGRLNGAEIARTEWYREGRVPLHTLRADIDYGVSEAHTTYGVIGIKVWVYKGEALARNEQPAATENEGEARRGRRRNEGADSKPGAKRPARRTGGDQADGAKRTKKEAGVNDAAAVEKEVS